MAAVSTASGRRPEVAGKPEAPTVALVHERFGDSASVESSKVTGLADPAEPLLVEMKYRVPAYARVTGNIRQVVWLQIVSSVLLVGLGYWLLRPLGITGIGIAWGLSQVPITITGLRSSRGVLTSRRPAVIKI